MILHPSINIVTNLAVISQITSQLTKVIAVVVGNVYLTHYSYLALLTGFTLPSLHKNTLQLVHSARFSWLAFRSTCVGLEWQDLYNNLPNEPYKFNVTTLSNSTHTTPSLNTLISINPHKPTLLDKAAAQNNFRPAALVKIATPEASTLDFVQSAGILIALHNERFGTNALLKDIKKYSETNQCPTLNERNKILEFTKLNLAWENIRYALIDLWARPLNLLKERGMDLLEYPLDTIYALEDKASFIKIFTNLAFHYRYTYQLLYFQKLVKIALIPYWNAYCPVDVDNNYVDEEWDHPEAEAPLFTTVKCECPADYVHNDCVIDKEVYMEWRNHQSVTELDFITIGQACRVVITNDQSSDKNQCVGCIEELVVEYNEKHHQTMELDGAISI